jgi:hypothetical protein
MWMILCVFCFSGCSPDNYDAPNATLTGRLLDSETNEAMPTQTPYGARIRIYEFYWNEWSPQPYDFWVKPDLSVNIVSGRSVCRQSGQSLQLQ